MVFDFKAFLPRARMRKAGLSNRFCPSVSQSSVSQSSVRQKILKFPHIDPHTLDMAINEHSIRIAALFDAHRQRCYINYSCTACILACRRSARGMCSMNTSSFLC